MISVEFKKIFSAQVILEGLEQQLRVVRRMHRGLDKRQVLEMIQQLEKDLEDARLAVLAEDFAKEKIKRGLMDGRAD